MLNTYQKSKLMGFSLIELLVGIAIMGILSAIAIPSFNTWMKNVQVRNAAEAITNGLQRARAEAVARNTNVALALGAGSSWTVSIVAPASAVESRSSNEGSKNVTVTVAPVGATTVTFNNVGTVGIPPNQPNNADGTAPFTQIDLAATGTTKKLRVEIGAGGNARMCDCSLTPNSSPRACLAAC